MRTIVISDYTFSEGTCDLMEVNGPYPGIATSIHHTQFCTEDRFDPDRYYPCVIPSVEEYINCSFAKTLFFKVNDWEDFSHKIGCNSVISIGCCIDRNPDTYLLGSELVATQRPIKRHEYAQAMGVVGSTGDPIKNCSNLMNFSPNFPYILVSGPFYAPFSTDCLVAQMKIPHSSLVGEVTLPNIQIVGVVE